MQVKQITIGIICLFFSAALHADYDAGNLKKLFTDKSQRAQLDAARSGNAMAPDMQQTNRVKLSGYMKRSNGKSVVWLNNKNTLESSKVGNVRVHRSTVGKNKKVTISIDGEIKRLSPGESWDKTTGKIVDSQ